MLAGFAIWSLAASIVTAILYAWDKRSATKGYQRIPESTLLASCLLGGWPGGFAAGKIFRHKTKKTSFRIKFGICVVLNTIALGVLLILSR